MMDKVNKRVIKIVNKYINMILKYYILKSYISDNIELSNSLFVEYNMKNEIEYYDDKLKNKYKLYESILNKYENKIKKIYLIKLFYFMKYTDLFIFKDKYYELSMKYYENRVKNGDMSGYYYMGVIHEKIRNNKVDMIKYYEMGANNGEKRCKYEIAMYYKKRLNLIYNERDYENMSEIIETNLLESSDNGLGYIYSIYELGKYYYYRYNKNDILGLKYLKMASKRGYEYADYKLGKIYYYKYNDIKLSEEYLKKVIYNKQNIDACLLLGYICEMDKRIEDAITYYKIAMNNNNSYAYILLGKIQIMYNYYDMKPGEYYLKRALKCNDLNDNLRYYIYLNLGNYYKIIIEDYDIALYYYEIIYKNKDTNCDTYVKCEALKKIIDIYIKTDEMRNCKLTIKYIKKLYKYMKNIDDNNFNELTEGMSVFNNIEFNDFIITTLTNNDKKINTCYKTKYLILGKCYENNKNYIESLNNYNNYLELCDLKHDLTNDIKTQQHILNIFNNMIMIYCKLNDLTSIETILIYLCNVLDSGEMYYILGLFYLNYKANYKLGYRNLKISKEKNYIYAMYFNFYERYDENILIDKNNVKNINLEECSICFEKNVAELHCLKCQKQYFCYDCLGNWEKHNNTCPTCRE